MSDKKVPFLQTNLPVPLPDSINYLDKLSRYLALSLSVPERAARVLSAIVGGTTMMLTATLLPKSIRQSVSYRFTAGMFQTFLIKNIAGMSSTETDTELRDEFATRKLLGSSLEAAGLLTMQFSPVWVFAIASDTAKGGQVFCKGLCTI